MKTLFPKERLGVIILVLALLGGAAVYFWRAGRNSEQEIAVISANTATRPGPVKTGPAIVEKIPAADAPKFILVHVAGSVKRPDVYRLPAEARAADAVKAAGGAAQNANLDAVNLAVKLDDGQQLYIPSYQEQPKGAHAADAVGLEASNRVGSKGGGSPSGHAATGKIRTPADGTVNLNAADDTELQRLPGVGPAMAQRILDYRRANGRFRSIEDLMNITGIGEKKFARLKPLVRTQ